MIEKIYFNIDMFFIKLLDYTVNKVVFMDVNVKPIKLSRLQYILFGFELYKNTLFIS